MAYVKKLHAFTPEDLELVRKYRVEYRSTHQVSEEMKAFAMSRGGKYRQTAYTAAHILLQGK